MAKAYMRKIEMIRGRLARYVPLYKAFSPQLGAFS